MILPHATTDDESALEAFDLGDTRSPWLDEVAEIVSGHSPNTAISLSSLLEPTTDDRAP